jgi:hypothetical protein
MQKYKGNIDKFSSSKIDDYKKRYGISVKGDKNNILLSGKNDNNLNIVKGLVEKDLFYQKNKHKDKKLNTKSKPGSVSSYLSSIY